MRLGHLKPGWLGAVGAKGAAGTTDGAVSAASTRGGDGEGERVASIGDSGPDIVGSSGVGRGSVSKKLAAIGSTVLAKTPSAGVDGVDLDPIASDGIGRGRLSRTMGCIVADRIADPVSSSECRGGAPSFTVTPRGRASTVATATAPTRITRRQPLPFNPPRAAGHGAVACTLAEDLDSSSGAATPASAITWDAQQVPRTAAGAAQAILLRFLRGTGQIIAAASLSTSGPGASTRNASARNRSGDSGEHGTACAGASSDELLRACVLETSASSSAGSMSADGQ